MLLFYFLVPLFIFFNIFLLFPFFFILRPIPCSSDLPSSSLTFSPDYLLFFLLSMFLRISHLIGPASSSLTFLSHPLSLFLSSLPSTSSLAPRTFLLTHSFPPPCLHRGSLIVFIYDLHSLSLLRLHLPP